MSNITTGKTEKKTNPLASAQALSSRIAAINEIAVAVNRSLYLDEILDVVAKKSKWLIDFDHLSIYLTRDELHNIINLFGRSLEIEQITQTAHQSIHRALQFSQPRIVHRVEELLWDDHAAMMIVPLEHQQQKLGAIIFSSTSSTAYNLDDIRIGYLLALQLSSAIRNAERFDEINRLYEVIASEQKRSEDLLLNILPSAIAEELKSTGKVKPVYYESASVLFTDFSGFTALSEHLTPQELVDELDICFSYFDQIIGKYGLEKLKTIGDGYMCVGGIPTPTTTHAIDTVLAAIEMQMFMRLRKEQKQKQGQAYWNLRIGIHSGSVMAGVIGRKKFAYDVWGDTVNIASRMESSGVEGKINISKSTFELIQGFFDVDYRGQVPAKNKNLMDMYLVRGIRDDLSLDPAKMLPNQSFMNFYLAICSETSTTGTREWIHLLHDITN